MSAITRKSSFFYFTHLCTFCLPGLGEVLLQNNRGMLAVMIFWVPIWLSSSVLWSERMESYAFLRTLPVTDREIARKKFGLSLGFAFAYWLILALFIRLTLGSTPESSATLASATLSCALSLVLAGGWHIVSWRFGASVLLAGVMSFIVIVFLGTIITQIEHRTWFRGPGALFGRRLAESPGIVQVLLLAAALAAYYGFYRAAVRVKAKSEAYL